MKEIKTYKKTMGIFWWTEKLSHFKFITRELTGLAVAFFSIELLLLTRSVIIGQGAYEAFIRSLSFPGLVGLNLIAFIALLYHSITWFNLAPKAMVVKIGEYRLPEIIIIIGNYLTWFVASGLLVWILIWKK